MKKKILPTEVNYGIFLTGDELGLPAGMESLDVLCNGKIYCGNTHKSQEGRIGKMTALIRENDIQIDDLVEITYDQAGNLVTVVTLEAGKEADIDLFTYSPKTIEERKQFVNAVFEKMKEENAADAQAYTIVDYGTYLIVTYPQLSYDEFHLVNECLIPLANDAWWEKALEANSKLPLSEREHRIEVIQSAFGFYPQIPLGEYNQLFGESNLTEKWIGMTKEGYAVVISKNSNDECKGYLYKSFSDSLWIAADFYETGMVRCYPEEMDYREPHTIYVFNQNGEEVFSMEDVCDSCIFSSKYMSVTNKQNNDALVDLESGTLLTDFMFRGMALYQNKKSGQNLFGVQIDGDYAIFDPRALKHRKASSEEIVEALEKNGFEYVSSPGRVFNMFKA